MARKLCTECGTRPQVPGDVELCSVCSDFAEWENSHSDHGHGDIDTYSLENTIYTDQADVDAYIAETKIEMVNCPVCHPELDKRYTKRAGHTNTATHSHTSHADHDHMRTPAHRALCRKSMKETGKPFSAK